MYGNRNREKLVEEAIKRYREEQDKQMSNKKELFIIYKYVKNLIHSKREFISQEREGNICN